ncbi:plasmid recombination protein [Brachybacterium sp. AOP25-B2-12]|uniref:plasmid recombination protein n=1 Tax=Brachybacterium sp. AOP25-B2-12 TaxID=3457710 RepID=UPI004034B096
MNYTATFDASHKVKRAGAHARNFERHIARDADQAAGFSFAQRNPNIDPARTSMNITMVNDGNGGWRQPLVTQDADGKDRPPSAELGDYLDARLATVTRKLRNDAVVMRPMILQLDPKWFAARNPDWRESGLNAEAEGYVAAQLEWAAGEFGHENLPGYSVHLDETNPQLQLLFTPVTKDGRLSQKDFFKGPGDLQRQHKEHREALADVGYEVEFKVSRRSKEHLSSTEYAAAADRVRDHELQNADYEDSLDRWAVDLSAEKRNLADRKRDLETRGKRFLASAEEKARVLVAGVRERMIATDFGSWIEQNHPEAIDEYEDEVLSQLAAVPRPRPPASSRKLTPARQRHLDRNKEHQRSFGG